MTNFKRSRTYKSELHKLTHQNEILTLQNEADRRRIEALVSGIRGRDLTISELKKETELLKSKIINLEFNTK